MSTFSWVRLVLLLALPVVLLSAAPASASCVQNEAAVSPTSAAPGQTVTVSSSTWFGICNDTGQQIDTTDRAVVTFVQGAMRVELGRTNSDADSRFTLPVRVPANARPGAAVLEVRGRAAADDVRLTVLPARALPRTGPPGALAPAALAVAAAAALARRRRS